MESIMEFNLKLKAEKDKLEHLEIGKQDATDSTREFELISSILQKNELENKKIQQHVWNSFQY
jgi:hypothetical protein